ncbi:hypothetical protein LMH73_007305 [Vibrio splendidus]|nr:hypothetical protein [Vibrio splendidus]MCC4880683.1 hypothetical protein [Vibrio splendidus]
MLSPLAFGVGAISLLAAFFSPKMLAFCAILMVVSITGFYYNYQLSRVYESGQHPLYQFNMLRCFDKDDVESFLSDAQSFDNDVISNDKHNRIKELLYKATRERRREQGYLLGYQLFNLYIDYLNEVDYAEYRLEVIEDEMLYVDLIMKWGVPQPVHIDKKKRSD